jgi:hypothetical protein
MAFTREKFWTARIPVEEVGAFRDFLLTVQKPYEKGSSSNNFFSVRDMLEKLDRYKDNYDAKDWSEEFRPSVMGETLMKWNPKVEFLPYLDGEPMDAGTLGVLDVEEYRQFIAKLRKQYPPVDGKSRIKSEIFSLTIGPAEFHEG